MTSYVASSNFSAFLYYVLAFFYESIYNFIPRWYSDIRFSRDNVRLEFWDAGKFSHFELSFLTREWTSEAMFPVLWSVHYTLKRNSGSEQNFQ